MGVRLLSIVLLAAGVCSACSCLPGSVEDRRDGAEIIFRGTIIELREVAKRGDSKKPAHIDLPARDSGRIVVFKVSRVWKGNVGQIFEMPGLEETSACIGFWPTFLRVGADLLVYSSRLEGSVYVTSICGRHKEAQSADKDFKILGAGKSLKPSRRKQDDRHLYLSVNAKPNLCPTGSMLNQARPSSPSRTNFPSSCSRSSTPTPDGTGRFPIRPPTRSSARYLLNEVKCSFDYWSRRHAPSTRLEASTGSTL